MFAVFCNNLPAIVSDDSYANCGTHKFENIEDAKRHMFYFAYPKMNAFISILMSAQDFEVGEKYYITLPDTQLEMVILYESDDAMTDFLASFSPTDNQNIGMMNG